MRTPQGRGVLGELRHVGLRQGHPELGEPAQQPRQASEPPVAHRVQLPGQRRIIDAAAVAEQVHRVPADLGRHLDASQELQAQSGRRRAPLLEAVERVVVGQSHRVQAGGLGRRHEGRGGVRAVGDLSLIHI